MKEVQEKGVYSLCDIKEFEECALTFKCPLKWEDLEKTDDEDVRYCKECMENVYQVPNLLAFKKRAKEKKCVSIKCVLIDKDDDRYEEILMGTPVVPKR